MTSHLYRYIVVVLGFLLINTTARSETANYTLDCWLSGDQIRERMGLSKFVRSMPNIFVIVDIEGKGRFLPSFIERGYKGQQMLITFKAPKPGFRDKITVNFYRDRSTSNHIWNKLLQTRLDGRFSAAHGVQVSGEWHIQLADEDLPLSPPEFLAQAVLVNPFSLSYKLYDERTKTTHGEVKLKID